MQVYFTSPWVPAEWIRAHGLAARGAWMAGDLRPDTVALGAGVCSFAKAVVGLAQGQPDSALVLTTTCDQMRR